LGPSTFVLRASGFAKRLPSSPQATPDKMPAGKTLWIRRLLAQVQLIRPAFEHCLLIDEILFQSHGKFLLFLLDALFGLGF
jgi:hypothetical protein